MKTKVFIDGSEGTTGLRIHERLDNRDDIELLTIAPELRKDPAERSRLINSSDITFLCLPDSAAREAVALVTNPNTRIIDASTALRLAGLMVSRSFPLNTARLLELASASLILAAMHLALSHSFTR